MAEDVKKSLERAQRWLKENTKRYAFKKLEREIVTTGVCTECGACVANCPVDALTGDRSSGKYVPTLTGDCVSCGICYTICPRTIILWSDLVGEFRSAWKARSLIEGHKGQDGGVATSLLAYMIEKGLVDGAVVAKEDDEKPLLPNATIVRTKEEVLKCAGTIYTHAPIVEKLVEALEEGLTSVAVVGTSCNIDAIHNMQSHPAGLLQIDTHRDAITIGLFCMESFDYPGLIKFLEEADIKPSDVKRTAIAGGKYTVTTSSVEKEWKVAELNPVAARSCTYCRDLTCKNADISCGNIGSDEGWTTVLVRTIRGEHVLQEALAEGIIEAEMLDAKALRKVQNVARGKATKYYKLEPEH